MAVDPFRAISVALKKAGRAPRMGKVVSVDYDEGADVLYARFSHGKIVDSKALDDAGMLIASLNSKGKIIGLVVLHASTLRD